MKINIKNKVTLLFILTIFLLSNFTTVIGTFNKNSNNLELSENPTAISITNSLTMEYSFSYPKIVVDDNQLWVYINESDLNMIIPNKPVLPVNITVLEFEFGTEIVDIDFEHSKPILINLSRPIACSNYPKYDQPLNFFIENIEKTELGNEDPYPSDWIYYHLAGGLSHGKHNTLLVNRIYPIRYFPMENQLQFIENITITITYEEPSEPILEDNDVYDLLIIAPSKFKRQLNKLVTHKNELGVKTRFVDLNEVYTRMYWDGRDHQEKIKYYIKNAIEKWGVTYVLLVGGIKGQTLSWHLPVRYSHVVPPEEQEYAEPSFISDIYYADIYDYKGEFSSWDSNSDNIFSVWNATFKEKMDLYPDVYLGRLPCRNQKEVKIMVNKIIKYEKQKFDDSWFKNLILVAGDSYNDTNHFNEGELIAEQAIKYMPGFNPVKVYASEGDINRRSVNKAMNQGAGFAYFCGHGNPASWTTHFPDQGTNWTTGYVLKDMKLLRNRIKLPVVIVGGCHNAQFDVTKMNIIKGIFDNGVIGYFRLKQPYGDFWKREWVPNCWAWKLTSKSGGGAIATIANTGLGTHGDGDSDNNSIADYLEVLDGWLELRFLQLYGEDGYNILGENHGDTLSEYLNRFLGNNEKMDVKMVQQWVLFGDPSLGIGGVK